WVRPMMVNRTSAMAKLGNVVQVRCRICANSSAPAHAGAMMVVSEIGDILSPKYAPEMIAPAVIGSDMSMPWATPISATPRVPATVQELPIDNATIAHTRQVAG